MLRGIWHGAKAGEKATERKLVMEETVKYLRALTFLQLQSLTDGTSFSKLEVLLERAGFTIKEIADLLNKSEAAVAKSLQRARAGSSVTAKSK